MWRPEDWQCKYLGKKADKYFELGADAMLEALKKGGEYQKCIDQWDSERPFETGIGWLIFIPDD